MLKQDEPGFMDRQTKVIDARGEITTTACDTAGNRTNLIDSVGNKTAPELARWCRPNPAKLRAKLSPSLAEM